MDVACAPCLAFHRAHPMPAAHDAQGPPAYLMPSRQGCTSCRRAEIPELAFRRAPDVRRSLRLCPSTAPTIILHEHEAEDGLQTSAWLLSTMYLGHCRWQGRSACSTPSPASLPPPPRRPPRAMAIGRELGRLCFGPMGEQRAEESVHFTSRRKRPLGFESRFRPCWEPKLK